MKTSEVLNGNYYCCKVSGEITAVRIDSKHFVYGKTQGWLATNIKTNKTVRVTSARRLRYQIPSDHIDTSPYGWECCPTFRAVRF